MTPVQELKTRLTVADVLHDAGIDPGGRRRIPCPIHDGDDRNFSYTDERFTCFSCGQYGDALDLAGSLFEIDLRGVLDRYTGVLARKPRPRPPGQREQRRDDEDVAKIGARLARINGRIRILEAADWQRLGAIESILMADLYVRREELSTELDAVYEREGDRRMREWMQARA